MLTVVFLWREGILLGKGGDQLLELKILIRALDSLGTVAYTRNLQTMARGPDLATACFLMVCGWRMIFHIFKWCWGGGTNLF